MILSIYFSSALILLSFFTVLPKKLTLLEISFCWMVIVYLYGTVMANVLLNNPTLLQMNPKLYYVWTFAFNRFIFLPILIIWFIDLYSRGYSLSIKIVLTAVFINALVGFEYLYEWLKIVQHKEDWNIGLSYILWGSLVWSIYILNACFRKILFKKVKFK